MYILNEKEYIREILASGNKPDNISNGYLITLIAKYYFDRGKDPNILIDTVKAKMLEFNIEGYQEYRYANKIKKTCIDLYDSESKNLFRELEYVPIYEKELKVVESLSNDRQKKFMFTLFAIARYMDSEGWINKKDSKGLSEVFKLANVTLSSDKKNELLHELYSNGYIHFGKKVNNLNIRIDLGDTNDNVIYKITLFENIGNQYIGNFKKGYKQCKQCGKKIKNTIHNRIYCPSCSKEIDRLKAKERMKTLRNTKMFEASKS